MVHIALSMVLYEPNLHSLDGAPLHFLECHPPLYKLLKSIGSQSLHFYDLNKGAKPLKRAAQRAAAVAWRAPLAEPLTTHVPYGNLLRSRFPTLDCGGLKGQRMALQSVGIVCTGTTGYLDSDAFEGA